MKKLAAAALALAIGPLCADAANAAQATSSASVQIVSSIALSNSVGLNFGQIAGVSSDSWIQVTPAGTRSVLSGAAVLAGGTVTAASFAVTGAPNTTYSITLPANHTVELSGPGQAMSVYNFTSSPSVAAGGLLDGSGQQTLLVGAEILAGSGQPMGAYAGTFDVTVAYN